MTPLRPSSHDPYNTSQLARILLIIGLIVSISFVFITKNPYDTGDSILHYIFARFAPQHPLNLFDTWAKPLFTLVLIGPAQFGLQGVMIWQCLLVAASAWLSYWIAEQFKIPYAALAILFCYTAPDYFRIQFSGLTEPLFGFILIASVALLVAGRAGWSAALVSWLPFVRSEGFILLGLWVLCLLWLRQWRFLPLLLLGYVVYSAAGAIVLGEPGWVFGRNSYPTISPYGNGHWKTFILALLPLMGWIASLLMMLGAVQFAWRAIHKSSWSNNLFRIELLLVYGVIATFLLAHTLFWVFGIFGSAGLTRVISVLTPLLALVALRGLSCLLLFARTTPMKQRVALVVAGLSFAFLFAGSNKELRWIRDFVQPGDLALAEQAGEWYRQLPGSPRPVVLEQPAVAKALDINIFDPAARPFAFTYGNLKLGKLPPRTLIFWDEWFSVVEGHLPLDSLKTNPHFRQRWAGSTMRQADDPGRGVCQLIVFEKID